MDIGKAALLELDKLGLLDVVKDIARSDKAFRQALSHWADKRADLDFVFDLIDIGMPSGKRLSKFSDQERARIREVTVQMTPAEADAFVALLEQPGKGMDMRGLIGELGLRGAEIQRLTQEARVALLADPDLRRSPRKLTDAVRQGFRGRRAAAAGLPIYAAFPYLSRTKYRGVDPDCDDVQDIIQALKDGDRAAAQKVASVLAKHPKLRGFRGVVVPAPRSSAERPALSLFAALLVKHGVGSRVAKPVIRIEPVESSRMRRRRGLPGVPEERHLRTLGPGKHGIAPDEPVLVVDDMVTTGATIRAVAAFLQKQGHTGGIIGAAAGFNVKSPATADCPVEFVARTAASNLDGVVEVPRNTHPVKLEPPRAKRKKFPFQGFIDFQGLEIDVENKAGSTRKGEAPDGTEWSTHMHYHYGEIRGTEGTDGDKLDAYVGPNHDSSLVVVVHQQDPETGKYDEDKVMLGFDSPEEAVGAYKKQYDRPDFYKNGEHLEMPIGQFWRWVKDERQKGKKVKDAAAERIRKMARKYDYKGGNFSWGAIEREVEGWNRAYSKVKDWGRARDDEALLKQMREDAGVVWRLREEHLLLPVLSRWMEGSGLDISKFEQYRRNVSEAAEVTLGVTDSPAHWREKAPLRRWAKNMLSPMTLLTGQVNAALGSAGPETFKYAGLLVRNPDRLPDRTIKGLLSGVTYVLALFQRRGVGLLLPEVLKEVLIRARTDTEKAQGTLGWYHRGKRAIELLADAVTARNPRMLLTWVQEVFLHEVGHLVHLDLLHPAAREVWDAGWEPVAEAREEMEEARRVTHKERKLFWKLLVAAKGNLRAIRLKGVERMKFHAWLKEPMLGGSFVTPKQLRWTKDGQRVREFMEDPEGYFSQYTVEQGWPQGEQQDRIRRRWKVLEDQFGVEDGYSSYDHPQISEKAMAEYRKGDSEVDAAIQALQIPTGYGQTNEREDFAETFVAFMDAPEKLSDVAKHRMQRALSISGLYGKPIMKLGQQVDDVAIHQYTRLKGDRDLRVYHLERGGLHHLGVVETGSALSLDLKRQGTESQVARAFRVEVQNLQSGAQLGDAGSEVVGTKLDAEGVKGVKMLLHPMWGPAWGDAAEAEDDPELESFHKYLVKQVRDWKGSHNGLNVTRHSYWPKFHRMVVEAVREKYGSKFRLYRGIYGSQAREAIEGAPLRVHRFSSWAASKDAAMAYRGRLRQEDWAVVAAQFQPKNIALAPVRLPGYTPDPDVLLPFGSDVYHAGDELVVFSPRGQVDARVVAKTRRKVRRSVQGVAQRWLARTAKTFKLEIGDPVFTGKYLNSPGRIEGFGEQKGDPTVKVRKSPKKDDKGQGPLKEVKLFKVRYDEAQAKKDKDKTASTDPLTQYKKDLWAELERLADFSIERQEKVRGQSYDIRALAKQVRQWGGTLQTPLTQEGLNRTVKFLLDHRPEDIDDWDGHHRLIRTLQDLWDTLGETQTYDEVLGGYRTNNYIPLVKESEKNLQAAIKQVEAAIKRVASWPGYRPSYRANYSVETFQPVESFAVGVEGADFTVFLTNGRIDEIDDVLEGGDTDFFRTPEHTKAYFDLVKELRRPGSSGKGKDLVLWTARPTKDRRFYERAKTLPPNIFLTNDINRAFGIGRDLGGSGERDIWKVKINSAHLVQTLDAGRVKDYQVVGDRPVPVRGMALVSEGKRAASQRIAGRWLRQAAYVALTLRDASGAELGTFNIPEGSVPYLTDGGSALAKTASRVSRAKVANAKLAQEYLDKLDELRKALREEPPPEFDHRGRIRDSRQLWMAFYNFCLVGRKWAAYVIDKLALPPKMAKSVEMAVRLLSAPSLRTGKAPRNGIVKWYEKNQKRLELLAQATTWPERSGEGDILKVGPFTVHNTVQASDKALDKAKGIIEKAVSVLRRPGVPGLPQVAYGNLYLVGQIGRRSWGAWYNYGKDNIYLRPSIRGVGDDEVARHLVHELGHRLWAKTLNEGTKKQWMTHHMLMEVQRADGRVPDEGEVLPFEVNRKTVRLDHFDSKGRAVLEDIKSGKEVGKVDRMRLWDWMADMAQREKFPSLYAAKGGAEEHFCEALSLKAFGKLKGGNLEAFDRIVVEGGDAELSVKTASEAQPEKWVEAEPPRFKQPRRDPEETRERRTARAAGLGGELIAKTEKLIQDYEDLLAKGDPSWPEIKAIGGPFADWFTKNFRVEVATTPRGQKALKELAKRFLWSARAAVSQNRSTDMLRSDWEQLRPHLSTLVEKFTLEGSAGVSEIVTPTATYINDRGLSTKVFQKYVKSLDALFNSLKGWRKKALGRGLKVSLAGPDKFRGTAAGVYRSEEDTLYVRATPKIMARSPGKYASPDYILIHELGHRYDHKIGTGFSWDSPQWWTTRYSQKSGFGLTEAFAELFALGHFGMTRLGSEDFGDKLERFEARMKGGRLAARYVARLAGGVQPLPGELVAKVAGRYMRRLAAALTLYHGTTQEFDRFDLSQAGKRDTGNLGRGIYLTKDPTFAQRYAEDNARRWGGEPVVLKVRAQVSRVAPFYKLIPQMKALGVEFPPKAQDKRRSEKLRQWLIGQGYDAAEAGNEIVVFDPRKLKILGREFVPTEQERMRAILRHFQETGETLTEQEILGRMARVAARYMRRLASRGVPFDQLPGVYQEALHEYFGAAAKRGVFQFGKMPVRRLMADVMAHNRDVRSDWGSWEEYHEWYMRGMPSGRGRPRGGVRWPVVLSNDPGEVIDDGWHRFHQAVEEGVKDIGFVRPVGGGVARVAAKYKDKKQVPKAKGDGTTTVYEYSKGQVEHRNREKAKRVEKLRQNLHKLRAQVKEDTKAEDPKTRLTALAVGLMNDTYERVGNEESAKGGHVGVTGWTPEHVKFGNGSATFSYTGKSGVKQTKQTKDADLIRVLKEAVKGKQKGDTLFVYEGGKVDAAAVNEYLKPFDITAKDIRGLHANREMQRRLKEVRSKGGKLPDDKKERDGKLKAEFKEALEGAAESVGHEASTLKSQYLVPGLEDDYLKDGTVKTTLKKASAGMQVRSQSRGEVGNHDHITMVEEGELPVAELLKVPGQRGEEGYIKWDAQTGTYTSPRYTPEKWADFVDAVKRGRFRTPAFIVVDHDHKAKVYEGNHRIRAAHQAGLKTYPVEVRYFGHAEKDLLVAPRVRRQGMEDTEPLQRDKWASKQAARYKCVPEGMTLHDYVRGYKQISQVRRIPIAQEGGEVVVGLEAIKARGLTIPGKPYMSTKEMEKLFSGEVVVEEKVDGHPMVAVYEGYTLFCESLKVRHSVDYDDCPYSALGWPDMLVVYDVLDGEFDPPYSPGAGQGKWLSRSEKETLCRMLGAPLVPLVFKGRVSPEGVPALADRISSFGSAASEGVVIKNLKAGLFGKFVNVEFQKRLKDEDTWGGVHPEQRGIRNVRKRAKTASINFSARLLRTYERRGMLLRQQETPEGKHHHKRWTCPSCGNTTTCRCSAPKTDVREVLCYDCEEKLREEAGMPSLVPPLVFDTKPRLKVASSGAGRLKSLKPTAVTEDGTRFQTGKSVSFEYARNTTPAPDMGSRFGQDIEPAGRYMLTLSAGMVPEQLVKQGWELGKVSFRNPLVIEWGGYGADGWKARLSKSYGGLKKRALTKAILADGYDGIVTVSMAGPRETPGFVREVVDLSVVGRPKLAATADWDEEGFYRRHPRLRPYRFPVVYVEKAGAGSHPEASTTPRAIELYPKFDKLPLKSKDFVFAHELGHALSGRVGLSKLVEAATVIGLDVWDTLSLPFGQTNMEEAFADSFASYHLDKDVQRRHPLWAQLVEVLSGRGKSATKTHSEREDEEAERLVRPLPKDKPPRHDKRRERMDTDGDEDTKTQGADKDKDLSLNYKRVGGRRNNYKRVAARWLARVALCPAKPGQEKYSPGDCWLTEGDNWKAWGPGHKGPQDAKDEEAAKAIAQGGKEEGEEDKGEKKEPEHEPEAPRKDTKELSEVAESMGVADRLESLQGDGRQEAAEAFEGKLEALMDSVAEDGIDSAMFKQFAPYLKGGKGKSPIGKGKSPTQLGEALAEAAFAQRVLANPAMVGGTAVSDAPKSPEQLRERAAEAFDQYKEAGAEMLSAASGQIAEQLEGLAEDSARRLELESILDGMALAAALSDKDISLEDDSGNPLRPEPAPQFKALAKALHRKGEAERLLDTVEEFGSPESREVVAESIGTMSDEELGEFHGGSDGPKGPLIDSLLKGKLGDEQQEYVRDLLRRMGVNEMTTGHALLSAEAEEQARNSGETTGLAKRIKATLQKHYDALKAKANSPESKKKVKTKTDKLMECLQKAQEEGDLEALERCREEGAEWEMDDLARYVRRAEKSGKLAPDHPFLAQAKQAIKTRNPEELEIRYRREKAD